MTLQTDFKALVGGIAGDRVYRNVAREGAAKPYIVYSRISNTEENTLDANGGDDNIQNTRLQIDVYASSSADADACAAAVKAALKGWAIRNVKLGEQDFYEPDTKLHRVMLDISTWHH